MPTLIAPPITDSLHRGDDTVHYRLDPRALDIVRDGQPVAPLSVAAYLGNDGIDLAVTYPGPMHIDDVLPG